MSQSYTKALNKQTETTSELFLTPEQNQSINVGEEEEFLCLEDKDEFIKQFYVFQHFVAVIVEKIPS